MLLRNLGREAEAPTSSPLIPQPAAGTITTSSGSGGGP